jgi:hypothetical protein
MTLPPQSATSRTSRRPETSCRPPSTGAGQDVCRCSTTGRQAQKPIALAPSGWCSSYLSCLPSFACSTTATALPGVAHFKDGVCVFMTYSPTPPAIYPVPSFEGTKPSQASGNLCVTEPVEEAGARPSLCRAQRGAAPNEGPECSQGPFHAEGEAIGVTESKQPTRSLRSGGSARGQIKGRASETAPVLTSFSRDEIQIGGHR